MGTWVGCGFIKAYPTSIEFAHPLNLPNVMLAMHPMKLSPLLHGEWAEDWMIRHKATLSEFAFAFLDHIIQLRDPAIDLAQNLFRRLPFRVGSLGGLTAFRQITEVDHQTANEPLLPRGSPSQRPSCRQTAFQVLHCPGVSQAQMLQNLCRTPFPFCRALRQFGHAH